MSEFDSRQNQNERLARHAMVQQQLRGRGIRSERVLRVMGEVPREMFVRDADKALAYDDRALAIDLGQTISQPYMVALMTELLDVQPDSSVLEVGTGSGYQTIILAQLGRHVYTVERFAELSGQARQRVQALGATNVTCLVGDGSKGWPEFAPYDRIIITAAAPNVPVCLVDQAADGGKLVIPVGGTGEQILTLVEKRGSRLIETPGIACRFVPLIGEDAWPER